MTKNIMLVHIISTAIQLTVPSNSACDSAIERDIMTFASTKRTLLNSCRNHNQIVPTKIFLSYATNFNLNIVCYYEIDNKQLCSQKEENVHGRYGKAVNATVKFV